MVNKRYMRKYDTCVGHEARINKLLLKKPLGIMSENVKGGRGREMKSESGARRRIFGDGLRSMGSARVGFQMLYVDGMLRRSGLGR